MSTTNYTERLTAISNGPNASKPAEYTALLRDIVSNTTDNDTLAAALRDYANTLLQDDVGIVVSRPLVTAFIEQFRTIQDPDVKATIGTQVIQFLAPKLAQYEDQDTQIKLIVADAYEDQQEFCKSAQTLQQISLDSTQKQHSADEKAKIWIRIVRCYLEEEDDTNAYTFLNKIKNVIHDVTDKETRLMFQLSQARIYDSQRSFLDAAQAYYIVSLETLVAEDERLQALSAAFICAILAPAGPQRARMLARLYKDERAVQVEHYPILEKIYLERIMAPSEISTFASKLSPHHLAKTADGSTVLEKAVLEHNVLGISKIYKNIYVDGLADLLGVNADRAEEIAAGMLEQGRIAGSIDQIQGLIIFQGAGSGERKTGHVEVGRQELRHWDANVQGLSEALEQVTTQIQKAHPDWYAANTEQVQG